VADKSKRNPDEAETPDSDAGSEDDKPTKKEKEIREAMKEDRGRRAPAQQVAKRETRKWEAEAARLLKRGTEAEMIEAIRRAGIDPDSPAGRRVLRVWRENQY
jgi:hypothetical protein